MGISLTQPISTMKRRTVLIATASAITTAALGSACNPASRPQLDVRFLERSLPLGVIKVFRSTQAQPKLTFEAESQLAGLFRSLQTWQSDSQPQPPLWRRWLPNQPQPQPPDLFTLGDGWLQAAIAQNLIQPLSIENLDGWQSLPPTWQQLVQRNTAGELDSNGEIWAAPYRSQPLIMAYSDRAVRALGRPPQTWADLWEPALRDRVALPDSPRLLMGLTLKRQGQSANAAEQFTDAAVQTDLTQLLQQAKTFDSLTSLKALINEDVWVAVTWSGDVISTLQRYRDLQGSFPEEGTLWSSDLWVRPAGAETDPALTNQWIEFCWATATARQISLSTQGISPLYLQPGNADPALGQPLLFPNDASMLEQSEALRPLSSTETADLTEVFQSISTALDSSNGSVLDSTTE